MIKISKSMMLAVLGLACAVSAVKAQNSPHYNAGDLVVGFTVTSGNDVMYDLGQESILTNGTSWNLASLLTSYGNLSTVNWGVIGNGKNSGTPRTAWTTTQTGFTPNTFTGNSAFSQLNTAMGALSQNFSGTTMAGGQSATVAAANSISWYTETVNGTLTTDYLNAYENPNVIGVGSADFSQVLNDGTTVTLLGKFTLAANGTLTFNTVSAAGPVAGFTGTPTNGFAPLPVVFTDASTGTITNWQWTLGDGTSVTNVSNASVNHTYAAAGTYTVSLRVAGPSGTNVFTQAGYVSVYSAPKINSIGVANGKLIMGGTNEPGGMQYRILSTTNLNIAASWKPVYTNNFLSNGTYSYTNSTTNAAAFFRLVSP